MMISLRNRLVLTYSLFACVFIALLSFVINHFASELFADFVSDSADEQSRRAASVIAEQYSPEIGGFDVTALHAIAMNHARQGFFVTVETAEGIILLEAGDFYDYAMRHMRPAGMRGPRDGEARRERRRHSAEGLDPADDSAGDFERRGRRRRPVDDLEWGAPERDSAGDLADGFERRERRRRPERDPEAWPEAWAAGEESETEARPRRPRRRPRTHAEADSDGEFRSHVFPMTHGIHNIGLVIVETSAPYFFDDNQLAFMTSLRRFLLGLGIAFALLSVVITVALANTLSKPILKAARAARRIAGGDWSARIPERHRTREIGEISRSLNHLAAALQDGDRRQKQLTTDVAHELRTPLTTLQGNMEAMIDGVWEPSPRRLASCHEEIVRLSRLVEDLGRLSLLEQKNLVLSHGEFDLGDLLANAMEQFKPAALEKGLSISLSVQAAPISADYDRLKQVFLNLVSNALKYTDKGGIEITVNAAGDEYAVSVADTGIGIPADEVPRVFERFFRADKSRNRATGGAGIGLSIAAAIVSAHGGRMDVSSESGRGSVFSVFLPKKHEAS